MFEPVKLTWRDKEYVVAPDKVLQLIAVVEEKITLEELFAQNHKRSKIAAAFSEAIRFAGGICTPEQVYIALFNREEGNKVQAAIDALLMLMIPPEALRKLMPQAEESDVKK